METTSARAILDEEHLRLLALGYWISGAITAFFSLIGLMYAGMGAFIGATVRSQAIQRSGEPPPAFVGWIFAAIGLFLFVAMLTMAILKFRVAVCLKRRQSRTFCLVVAGISCLEVPYGTALGALTFMALGRPSVMAMFHAGIGDTAQATSALPPVL
jgi:hypothetical protein